MQMRVVEGPNKGRTYPLDAKEITIGRSRNPGDRAPGWVLLYDETVSRIHADLRWSEEKQTFTLYNRSETNPTRVNDQIWPEVDLKVGDQIKVGNSILDLQQADFRFGGMDPTHRALRPAIASGGLNLQMRTPGMDNESKTSTKKAQRVVSLTTRPKFHLEVLAGPDKGQKISITGLTIALGGPHGDYEPPMVGQEKWWDQEIILADPNVPTRSFSLAWRELANGFELALTPNTLLSVTLERRVDGTEWIAELPPTSPVMLRAGDYVYVGQTALQLVVPEPE